MASTRARNGPFRSEISEPLRSTGLHRRRRADALDRIAGIARSLRQSRVGDHPPEWHAVCGDVVRPSASGARNSEAAGPGRHEEETRHRDDAPRRVVVRLGTARGDGAGRGGGAPGAAGSARTRHSARGAAGIHAGLPRRQLRGGAGVSEHHAPGAARPGARQAAVRRPRQAAAGAPRRAQRPAGGTAQQSAETRRGRGRHDHHVDGQSQHRGRARPARG